MRIGVLSDTHMPSRARVLPHQLFTAFEGVELILHAGDLTTLDVLDPLRAIAPVEAVVGNTDPWDVAHRLPEQRLLELDGVSVGLVHGHVGPGRDTKERARRTFPDARVVVFGHSHWPLIVEEDGQLLLNPGSPTDRRTAPQHSCAILTIVDGRPAAELITW